MRDIMFEGRERGEQRQQTFRRHEWEERRLLQKYESAITVFWNGPAHRGEKLRRSRAGKFFRNPEGKE